MDTVQPATGANIKAIGLVSGAHLYSHFYILLLPPLFPLLRDAYGVGFTELGFAITLFSAVTGLTQAPVGFLVDRIGARTLLVAALIVESLAFAMVGLVPTYAMLLAMMVVAGLANAIYHPADYAILNASVTDKHMGRAFSVHTAAGFFGGFLAPALAIPMAGVWGWETAVVVCASSGVLMAVVMLSQADALHEVSRADHRSAEQRASGAPSGLALLLSVPVMMGLLFYVGLSTFGQGLGNFSVSALSERYPAELTSLGLVLSAYLFANPLGVLAGGWVADNIRRHDLFAAACFVGVAAVLFTVAALTLPLLAVGVLFATAGLLNGLVAPSRDMLIRSMTPPGEMGKVFGFVSTGFNIGGIVAPLLFGYLLDHSDPAYVFWVAGVVSLLTVPTVLVTGLKGRQAASRRATA